MARSCILFFCLLFPATVSAAAREQSFKVEKVAEDVYAALAQPGGAASNAFFVVGDHYVVVGGAHLNKSGVERLTAAVAAVTDKPIRYFILPHHHSGYTAVDFDFPPDREVIMSWQSWQDLEGEGRKIPYPVLFFTEEMTLKAGKQTIIVSNVEKGHSGGDILVYLPESDVLFASDLVYIDRVGYLGSGYMGEWIQALELIEQIGAGKVIPGYGPVGDTGDVTGFKLFLKDFLTEVLRHIEAGDSLEKTLRTFSLPRHEARDGYRQFFKVNVERAYADLKTFLAD